MRHLLVCLALLPVFMLVSGSGASYVGPPAQKKDVEVEKRPYIEITKRESGKFEFRVYKGDGKVIGESALGYATVDEARDAIAEFKETVRRAEVLPRKYPRRPFNP
jgi:uncharacterized protein YegP (UPF0339 family)